MDKMELQKTAEHVVELEARIFDWRGNVPGWIEELSRLREAIKNLIRNPQDEKDPTRDAFLRCLELKTNRCQEHVLKRANWTDTRHSPAFFRYY
jgi:hypothetical protein